MGPNNAYMKPIFASLFYCIIICSACNNKATSILKTSNLESSFISIDADSGYTLKTGKGSIIKISAETFVVDDGQKVDIEIKEAFTMQDILLAGLTTESNGRPLKSGGMIYFNATSGGNQLDINKPIGISIPSETYDSNMQLFKGEIKDDSSINWVDPVSLDTTPVANIILTGERLFKNNCASCHKVFNLFTGPAMGGTIERMPNKQWLYDFIASPAKMIAKKDPYALQLYNKWKPTVMTAFPQLGKEGVDAIYAYVENEVRLNPNRPIDTIPSIENNSTSEIDCGNDTIFISKQENSNTINVIENTTTDPIVQPNEIKKASEMEGLRNGFTDGGYTTGMYDFTIQTMGWYNIDAYVEGYEGSTEVELTVKLNNSNNSDMNLYLFCPSRKMLSVGMPASGNVFSFKKINDKIPLFLNDDAIIVAFGSSKTTMYYGTAAFKVAKSQQFTINLKETTKEEINSFIIKNNIDGIKIDSYKKEFTITKRSCDDMFITDSSHAYK